MQNAETSNTQNCLDDLPVIMTVQQLAEVVHVSRGTIAEQIRRGNLKALNLCPGGRPKYRLLRDDVVAWMTANPVDPIHAEVL